MQNGDCKHDDVISWVSKTVSERAHSVRDADVCFVVWTSFELLYIRVLKGSVAHCPDFSIWLPTFWTARNWVPVEDTRISLLCKEVWCVGEYAVLVRDSKVPGDTEETSRSAVGPKRHDRSGQCGWTNFVYLSAFGTARFSFLRRLLTLLNRLSRQLRSIEHHGSQFIIADELWFHKSWAHTGLLRRTAIRKANTYNSKPKMKLTIAWNSWGPHVLNTLPKGRTFNAEYYRDNILPALLPLSRRSMGENSLFMQTMLDHTQFDSVELFHRKQTAARRTPIVLAWFGTIRLLSLRIYQAFLERMVFRSLEERLAAIREMLAATPKMPYRAYLTTGWRDSNGFLRTVRSIVPKLDIG
jgi:hypothetical protein